MRHLYAEWIAAIVATALVPVVACGGTTAGSPQTNGTDGGDGVDGGKEGGPPTPAPIRPGFTKPACKENDTYLSSLSATPAFDYVELRVQDGYRRTEPDQVVDKIGTLCKTATDEAACKAAFAKIQRPIDQTCSVPYPCSVRYLATTRGDEVKTFVAGKDDLAKIAAPIDSYEEALFVLGWSRPVSCENTSYKATADGFDIAYSYSTDRCTDGESALHEVLLHVTRDGVVTEVETKVTPIPVDDRFGCPAARRASEVAYASFDTADLGDWLARAAYLEAASVGAFARLARELAAHGAPPDLVGRVALAARQERIHAQLLRREARKHGKSVPASPRIPRSTRSLGAIALENAIEGSARETWGAIVVSHQAECAAAPELRAIFRSIARDEASHASLAADVAAWLSTRLSPTEDHHVKSAYRATLAALEKGALLPVSDALCDELGIPSTEATRRMFESARAVIFDRARPGLTDVSPS